MDKQKVSITGRVVKHPFKFGKDSCRIRVGCEGEYFSVRVDGDLHKYCLDNISNGDIIKVVGKLKNDSYMSRQTGQTVYTIDVIAEKVKIVQTQTISNKNISQTDEDQKSNNLKENWM
jgi:single-stranded DNA-binding protein